MPTSPRLLQAAPTHFAVQIGLISVLVVFASLVLRVALPESGTTQKAFPFMFLLGAIGIVASAWLWYFRQPRTNAATALFFVGNMVLVALIVLPFALLTKDFRRRHDPPPRNAVNSSGPGKDGTSGKDRGPAGLAVLGYLPPDSNLIVGVHVADLLREPAGKEFLDHPTWKPLEFALAQVEKWTGLQKDAMDCIALGACTDRLRLTVAVQTKAAYDPASFRILLEDSKPLEHHGRLLYPLLLNPFGQGILWCVNDRTLLLTLWWDPTGLAEMKKSLPLKERPRGEGLSSAVRDCLEKRVPRTARIWVVGQKVPSPVLAAVLPFARSVSKNDQAFNASLKKVRVFDASLRFASSESIALVGDLEGADPQSASVLQRALEQRIGMVRGLATSKVVGPATHIQEQTTFAVSLAGLGSSPGGSGTLNAISLLAERRRYGQERDADPWVSFQLEARPSVLNDALRSQGGLLPWLGKR